MVQRSRQVGSDWHTNRLDIRAVQRALQSHWLQDKPKPVWMVCDSARSFASKKFVQDAAESGIGEHLTPGQAPWAHGELEHTVKIIKDTVSGCAKECHEERFAVEQS